MDSLHDLFSLSEIYRLPIFVSEELFSTLQSHLHRRNVVGLWLLYRHFPWKAFRRILLLISISSNLHVLIVANHGNSFRIPLVVCKPLKQLLPTNSCLAEQASNRIIPRSLQSYLPQIYLLTVPLTL